MSDITGANRRKRGQTLLIVEGNHEKEKLFRVIFKSFPELHMDMDNNVLVYGTNIYMLYLDLVREYGEDWWQTDVDLPFLVSRKKGEPIRRYKRDFNNIILIFDYDRHDPGFSEQKIVKMQEYFNDMADNGRLYLNYPMIEAYQHLKSMPDEEYSERIVSVTLQPGARYKELVKKDSGIKKYFEFPQKVEELLKLRFEVQSEELADQCCESILGISNTGNLSQHMESILREVVRPEHLLTARYQFVQLLSQLRYISEGKSFWDGIRELFRQIIIHNICKADRIQHGTNLLSENQMQECFAELDLAEILRIQNDASRDSVRGYIWVVCTCVFLVAEYSFALVMPGV